MKGLKLLFWLVSWATLWVLFAKKSWKKLRDQLKWKENEEKAKIIWTELLSIWKEILEEVKDLSESEAAEKLKTLWKEKLETLTKEIKENWNEKLKELLPKLECAVEEGKKIATKKAWDFTKCASRKCKEIKKEVKKEAVKTTKEVKKTVEKKIKEVKKNLTK